MIFLFSYLSAGLLDCLNRVPSPLESVLSLAQAYASGQIVFFVSNSESNDGRPDRQSLGKKYPRGDYQTAGTDTRPRAQPTAPELCGE
jgi:hypothetical protein